jgi:hypothetical protein
MLDFGTAIDTCKEIKSDLPECGNSLWSIEKFEISNEDRESFNLHEAISGMQGGSIRCVEPGTYTRLIRLPSTTVMSDTTAETRDLLPLALDAKGEVLIAGLGLGIAIDLVMRDKDVKHVTVIEISQEIIDLVGDHFKNKYGDRLTIINADILEWKAPKDVHYDYCWFDIWDNICSDNLKDMTKLKRKYAKKAERKGFWAEAGCLIAKRRWG